MSWKGFQKAMARLPQIVKQKTGMSEGTIDEEFKELNLTYVRIRQDTTKFLNECISFKAAMLNLLNFQVSLLEEHQWNLNELSKGSSLNDYIKSLHDLRSDLSSQLEDSVDRLLIKPLTEYQLLLVKVESIIKKRNNKLLDYDRNKHAYEKMSQNPSKRNEMSEEKKILKQEQVLSQSTIEYDRYNNLLKHELPHLLDLRSQLLKPGIQTLLAFQKLFYTKSAAIFSSPIMVSLTVDKVGGNSNDKFEKEIEPIMREIRNMGMFHGSGLLYSTGSTSEALSSTSTLGGETTNLPNPPEYSSTLNYSKNEKIIPRSNPNTLTVIPSSLEPNRVIKPSSAILNTGTKPSAPIPPKSSQHRHVKAIYDFSSEDSEDLSFKMGELIEVLDSSDQYGWWIGKNSSGKRGNFPSNYVIDQ